MKLSGVPSPLAWLRANKHSLAPLTGQDTRALHAIAACWELFAVGDFAGRQAALSAVSCLLRGMQRKCWPLAKELVARSLDWDDRERVWQLLELPPDEDPEGVLP